VASPADLEKTRSLLSRIEERGFGRGKALLEELDALLQSA
jgi:hypothetical protein